ncbi:hypothetical protein [uncultured Bartonella sp.]|nr:hypothetical protein [uncultured Bartonella sp.]
MPHKKYQNPALENATPVYVENAFVKKGLAKDASPKYAQGYEIMEAGKV